MTEALFAIILGTLVVILACTGLLLSAGSTVGFLAAAALGLVAIVLGVRARRNVS